MAVTATNHTEWFTLSEASKLLGVHPATIRQWSDEGKLATFRTPGGHRRFARSDIDRLLQVTPVRGARLQSYVVEETVERTRKGLPDASSHVAWAHSLPEDERAHWRSAGRQLLGLVSQLVSRPSLSDEHLQAALSFGRDYGAVMVRLEHSLPDAVLTFLFFRDSILETMLALPETTGLDRSATLEIVGRVNKLLYEVLRVMMESYEAATLAVGQAVQPDAEAI